MKKLIIFKPLSPSLSPGRKSGADVQGQAVVTTTSAIEYRWIKSSSVK